MKEQKVQEVAKYRKKRDSASKSAVKSKHKHSYAKCLLHTTKDNYLGTGERDDYALADYCTLCGKLSNIDFMVPKKVNDFAPYLLCLMGEDIYQEYKDLYPVKEVEDLYTAKYCTI